MLRRKIERDNPEKIDRSRDKMLRGAPLQLSLTLEYKYRRALVKLTKAMIKQTYSEITELFKGDTAQEFIEQQQRAAQDATVTDLAKKVLEKLTLSFSKLFDSTAKKIAKKMISEVERESKTKLNASLKTLSGGLTINRPPLPKGLEASTQAMIQENVDLITTIPKKYLSDVSGTVYRAITRGSGLAEIHKTLDRYAKTTERRIDLMALDQMRKAFNGINKLRMEAVGVKKFIWRHNRGSQTPRKDHIEMSGNVYSFSKLPVIDKRTGERGIPGQAINCRCTMEPVIEFDDDDEE